MKVRCPGCKKLVPYENNPHRPFCSKRCQMLDLGDWADGKYSIPTEESTASSDEEPKKSTLEGEED